MAERVFLKRAYEAPVKSDGTRVLVDRLWPRGISKEALKADHWLKEVAPSTELRKWFDHDPEKWAEMKKRYKAELGKGAQKEAFGELKALAKEGPLTLVYGAKDEEYNQAVILKELLTGKAG